MMLVGVLAAGNGSMAQSYVTTFGNFDWFADDTRDGSLPTASNGLLGLNYSHPSYGTGTSLGDTGIAQRIVWETPSFASPNGLGALKLSTLTPAGAARKSSGKATLSLINTDTGFAPASSLTESGFYGSLTYYNPAAAQLALRINVQSSQWTQSQTGYSASIIGESTWDLALVYVGSGTGAWTTDALNSQTGLWSVFKQSGNTYFGGTAPERKTLQQLASDPIWGPRIFGTGSVISNVQLGVGSSSTNQTGYASSLQLSFLNGGRPYQFVDGANVSTVTTVEPTYSSSTSKVYEVTGDVSSPGETVAIANTGTSGEQTTFSIQPGATVTVASVTVESGGVLTGSGVVDGSVNVSGGVLRGSNNVTGETAVSGGALHAPGFSPAAVYSAGSYQLDDATLQIEIGGTDGATGPYETPVTGDYDQLLFLGDAEITSFATIEIAQWNGFTLSYGQTFNILYAENITLDLDAEIIGVGAFAGFSFELNVLHDVAYDAGTYDVLQVTALPEPSTAMLALLGAAAVLASRRRVA